MQTFSPSHRLAHRHTYMHTHSHTHTFPDKVHIHTLTVGPRPLLLLLPCLFVQEVETAPAIADSPGRKTDCQILGLTQSNAGSPPIDSPLMLPSSSSISAGCASDLGEIAGLVTRPYTSPAHPSGAPLGLMPSKHFSSMAGSFLLHRTGTEGP